MARRGHRKRKNRPRKRPTQSSKRRRALAQELASEAFGGRYAGILELTQPAQELIGGHVFYGESPLPDQDRALRRLRERVHYSELSAVDDLVRALRDDPDAVALQAAA